jgi:hypothetical protein
MAGECNSRRGFLQNLASGFAIAEFDFPRETRSLYSSPPADTSPSEIDLIRAASPRVPTNEWIAHQFGWQTEGDEGPLALETVRSAASSTFLLNSVEVTDFQQGWLDIKELPTGQHLQEWRYIVPPLPPGKHSYQLELEFEDPIRTPGNPEWVWDGTYRFEGSYSVTSAESISDDNKDRSQDTRTEIQTDAFGSVFLDEEESQDHGQ